MVKEKKHCPLGVRCNQNEAKKSICNEFVFLIGPGGVGKTTTGKHLSERIDYDFVDLDDYFCENVADIRSFISDFGYREYVIMNSCCFNEIICKFDTDTVISLSSGFLIIEEADAVVESNREAVQRLGTAVLLVPSLNYENAADIVAKRQIGRGFGLKEEKERKKFLERIEVYESFANYTEISSGHPRDVADRIAQKLERGISRK